MDQLAAIFNEVLPLTDEKYIFREQQVRFAERVRSIISEGGNGLIEGGTGVGKTFGYLFPVMESDDKAIISTGTKNLQDQLFLKDLPKLTEYFPSKRVFILKGRANYLCGYRMKSSLRLVADTGKLDQLMEIRSWSSQTTTGDLTEILDTENNSEILDLVTSTKEDCLGNRCPEISDCSYYLARERAKHSDVVIVNHHLLFADLAHQEDGLHSILPNVGIVLIDEAHRVLEVARKFCGKNISSRQIVALIKDIDAELVLLGNDDPITRGALSGLQSALDRLTHDIVSSETIDYKKWLKECSMFGVVNFDYALNELIANLDRVAERSRGLQHLLKRSLALADLFALLTDDVANDVHIQWLERRDGYFSIYLSPLSIADTLRRVFCDSSVSWIFTSATLSLDKDFKHTQTAMGLETAKCWSFDSPFDYSKVVRAWLPDSLPLPRSEGHISDLVEAVMPLINCNHGRTLFLFTSYSAMRKASQLLSFMKRPLLVQGVAPSSQLRRSFIERPGAVLLATRSFWEGVDFRGADLHCLIIDKLPFPNPLDPIYAAEEKRIEKRGGDSFAELALPTAAMALKQGFGRLIRQETDKGLFVLGDSRIRSRDYGDFILANLPEMMWLASSEDATDWLRTLW